MKNSIKREQSKLVCSAERENFRLKGKKFLMTLAAGRTVLTIVFCCAMTTTVLTACTDANDNPANPVATSAVDNGVWLVTPEMMDLSYRPGDDFFMYCTGGFWKATTVDESKRDINKGMMKEAGELMNQRVAALDIPARTKLKADLEKTDDASVTLMKETIQNAVDRLQAVTTKEELWHLVGQLMNEGYKIPLKPQLFSYHGRMATVLFNDSESDFSAGLLDSFIKENMKYTTSHAFAEAYITPAMKQQTREICEELRKSFRQRIAANQWMSAASKQNAIEKLDAMVFNIGCPGEWFEEGLPDLTDEPTVLHDVMAVRRAKVQLVRKLIGMEPPRASLHMLVYSSNELTEINAFYVGNLNSMNIYPVWMLKPFCDETLNEAHNYAAYAFFGHEMTHGFDTNGAGFNKIGDPEEIWASDADSQEFQRRANQLAECYSGFEVMPWALPGVYNDGAYTVAENIADLGGFLMAYDTYVRHLQDAGFTGEQFDLQRRRFYEALAWLWHSKYSAIYAHDRTLDTDDKDEHSLNRERVNGIFSNTDDWYDLFGVKAGDKLYRAEDKRIRIW